MTEKSNRIKQILKTFLSALRLKTKYHGKIVFHRGITVYKPISLFISKKARVRIKDFFEFNKQWDIKRQLSNIMGGSLYLDDNTELTVNSFVCYAGSRITVNNGGKLFIKSGFMNYESAIECFNHIEIGEDCRISERVMILSSFN